MFDYFRNNSSNAYHVCCDDSPAKGLYGRCQSDDRDLHSRSKVRLKLDNFLMYSISENISAISFKLGLVVDLIMDVIHAHTRSDDLDLDARSQWDGKASYALGN